MTQERSLTGAGAASSQRYQVWQLRLQFIIDLLFYFLVQNHFELNVDLSIEQK